MARTRHFIGRVNERRISEQLIELTMKFGRKSYDGKVVLNRKALHKTREKLTELLKSIDHALKRDGCVVVCNGETLITSYSMNSRERTKRKKPVETLDMEDIQK